jgi:hypothetical protein
LNAPTPRAVGITKVNKYAPKNPQIIMLDQEPADTATHPCR